MSFSSSRKSGAIPYEQRYMIGIVADDVTTIGFLLAGIGHKFEDSTHNYLIVNEETHVRDLEKFIMSLYNRKNMGILLVASDVLEILPNIKKRFKKMLPILLEIPTKPIFSAQKMLKHTQRFK